MSYLNHVHVWVYTECCYIALILQDDAFSTGTLEAWHTVVVIHSNGQMMTWRLLLYQDVRAVVQVIKGYALERDVVGVSINLTATYRRYGIA